MPAERGFTLIEILLVVTIIGITLGFVLLRIGDFGASRRALVTAEQFSSYIKLVQQRAILEATAFGIKLTKEGYLTYRFADGVWQPLVAKPIFQPQSFPNSIVVGWLGSSSKHPLVCPTGNSFRPDIVIRGSGDMTEFMMDFGTKAKPNLATLVGKPDGQLSLSRQHLHEY
jgi:general secretion pathway protein H